MRRLGKFFINLTLALIAVALTFTVIFFFNPSWQQAGIEKLLSRDTARQWQVGSVSLGPRALAAADVFVMENTLGVEIGEAHLEGPFWQSPFSGVVQVDSGSFSGVLLDVSQMRVGDLTSEDWRAFVDSLPDNAAFWKERIVLVLQKVAASGYHVELSDVSIRGMALLPGKEVSPLHWRIRSADSREPFKVQLEALPPDSGEGHL